MQTVLSIDKAGGKFESWYYINGNKKRGLCSFEFKDITKWAANLGFVPRPTRECFIALIPSDQWAKIMQQPNDLQLQTIDKVVSLKMSAFMTLHPFKKQ